MDFKDKVLSELVAQIRVLEAEIERRIVEQRAQFHYRIEHNRVRFETEFLAKQRALRKTLWQQIRQSPLSFFLVSPVIYSLIVPLALLDLTVALYQAVCFPVYGVQRVPRSDFVVIDRHHLAYLNPLQKLNCVYCGYANGVIGLVREVAARTEEYWCPIKHASPVAKPHSRYVRFVDYGDGEGYIQRQDELRRHATGPDDAPSDEEGK